MTDPAGSADRAPRSLFQGVYAIVDPGRDGVAARLDAILGAGIRLVQLRPAAGGAGDWDALVGTIRAAGAVAIANDHLKLAARADGIHLGQEDAARLGLAAVRERLGGGIVGLSCGTPAEARAADPRLVDYLGVGPVFPSPSKTDAGPPIGINGVRVVVAATPLPCAAIGGITPENLRRVRESGAAMAAVIGALAGAEPAAAAQALVAGWTR